MFARIEVALRPEVLDSAAQGLLRRIELANPDLRRKIRWARFLEVYWIDIPVPREELIAAITEICWDKVLQWVFTGNLMPSAAGKTGGLLDLMQQAPYRPGKFWGIERRFRAGVTDNVGRTLLEAFEIVMGKDLAQSRTSSGGLFLLEGLDLDEDSLATIAREVFCNELIETWTLVPEDNLKKNDRFHQERVKYDLPKIPQKNPLQGAEKGETFSLKNLSDTELEELSKKKFWALSLVELKAIRDHFGSVAPTDVEMEVIAQTWSEHCKHKIFNAKIHYREAGKFDHSSPEIFNNDIPHEIDSLFKQTISGTTAELPRPWLLSVFEDNAGICTFDDEDAFCIKVETHNSPSALDPYGGALTGIVGVNRDILGCGLGAKPIFNTDVFCVAPPDYSQPLPDRILHPRRILEGVRRGVEHGGNKSGIPTLNGALVFDDRYLGKPLIYCGTGGLMPRKSAGEPCELKRVLPGDRICMVGGRIGKDGIHGATFSSLALDAFSPSSAVQLGDPLTQKRAADFLLEARDLGLYRAITDNGAGGLSSSVGEMARLSGGAYLDVTLAKTKYPGLKPFELVVSESQERMTVAVPPEKWDEFSQMASRRGVEVSDLGEFNQSGRFEIVYEGKTVANLDLSFLHTGVPRMELTAEWKGRPKFPLGNIAGETTLFESFASKGSAVLLELLGRPNIASKEWLIRQYDHEVQGTSVIKPLHTFSPGTSNAWSGPNDAGVIKPKLMSDRGLAVGCGILPKLSDIDPYLMAQASVDEAIRNVLCVGVEYGTPEAVLALVDNFCWPDPVGDATKAGWLVRACYGLRDAALALGVPLVSGKDSMKNDFRGKRLGQSVSISVPPTLLMTAVGRVQDIKLCRTADFKAAGDAIYVLGKSGPRPEGRNEGRPGGGSDFGILGSEFYSMMDSNFEYGCVLRTGEPDWKTARNTYSWLGKSTGKQQIRLKSLHDVSEGGLLTAVSECMIARGLGAQLRIPLGKNPWEFMFGEGFHSFVATLSEENAASVEAEWNELAIPFVKIGTVTHVDRLEVFYGGDHSRPALTWGVKQLRAAWLKEGYWE